MNISYKASNFILRNVVSDNFIKDIAKIPMLTREEERELFIEYEASQERMKAAEGSVGYMDVYNTEIKIQDEIRNEIITRNQRFNLAVAKRYCGNELLMELVNVGAIGMYEAFQKYNYKTDNRFCSFAVWYIRRAINAFINRENVSVRTKNNTIILSKVLKIENDFFTREGRYPSDNEIKDILKTKYNITDANANDFHKIITTSIDSEDNDSNGDDFNVINYKILQKTADYNEYENTMANEDLCFKLNKMLNTLNEREQIIVKMSSGYGYIKEFKDYEIAEELEMSSERVRQIRIKALSKLKKQLAYNKF